MPVANIKPRPAPSARVSSGCLIYSPRNRSAGVKKFPSISVPIILPPLEPHAHAQAGQTGGGESEPAAVFSHPKLRTRGQRFLVKAAVRAVISGHRLPKIIGLPGILGLVG